ncbi:MAG: hypothetical protein P8P30_00010 [Rickettsiales bacterium]|nr:hypothetical protein [Rickettsiales bacterium]
MVKQVKEIKLQVTTKGKKTKSTFKSVLLIVCAVFSLVGIAVISFPGTQSESLVARIKKPLPAPETQFEPDAPIFRPRPADCKKAVEEFVKRIEVVLGNNPSQREISDAWREKDWLCEWCEAELAAKGYDCNR